MGLPRAQGYELIGVGTPAGIVWVDTGHDRSMLIAGVIVFCVALLILAFVFPKLSRHPERAGKGVLGLGSRGASKAPGKLGRWLSKPFASSSKAVGKSGSAGRKGRSKMPL